MVCFSWFSNIVIMHQYQWKRCKVIRKVKGLHNSKAKANPKQKGCIQRERSISWPHCICMVSTAGVVTRVLREYE